LPDLVQTDRERRRRGDGDREAGREDAAADQSEVASELPLVADDEVLLVGASSRTTRT
jgi:hypothetical protein